MTGHSRLITIVDWIVYSNEHEGKDSLNHKRAVQLCNDYMNFYMKLIDMY